MNSGTLPLGCDPCLVCLPRGNPFVPSARSMLSPGCVQSIFCFTHSFSSVRSATRYNAEVKHPGIEGILSIGRSARTKNHNTGFEIPRNFSRLHSNLLVPRSTYQHVRGQDEPAAALSDRDVVCSSTGSQNPQKLCLHNLQSVPVAFPMPWQATLKHG